jgi:hypothetical protein
VREGTQVKQRTLLNLGKDFAIETAHWPLLAARIEQRLQSSAPHQAKLFALANEVDTLFKIKVISLIFDYLADTGIA